MSLRTEVINKITNYLNDANHKLKRLNILLEKIDKLEREINIVKKLYYFGYIKYNEYKHLVKEYEEEKNYYKGLSIDILYQIIANLNEAKSIIGFLEKSEIDEKYKKTLENFNNNIKEIENNVKIIENEKLEISLEEKLKIYEKILESKKKKKEKEKIDIKIPRTRIKREEYYMKLNDTIVNISNKMFLWLSNRILNKYPQLSVRLNIFLSNYGLYILPQDFISVILFSIFMIFLSGIFLFLLFVNLYVFLALIASISFFFIAFYIRVQDEIKKYNSEVERNLPFAVIHLQSLLQSGIPLESCIKIVSDMKEYGSLAKEFKKISRLLDMGVNIVDALEQIKNNTPSKRFYNFLSELILTIRSGRKLDEFFLIAAEQELLNYRSSLQRLNKSLKTFSDLYVGMVLTIPMILISMGVMASTILKGIFGMTLDNFLTIMVLVVIPLINLAILISLSRIET